jgi:hypothetical protein
MHAVKLLPRRRQVPCLALCISGPRTAQAQAEGRPRPPTPGAALVGTDPTSAAAEPEGTERLFRLATSHTQPPSPWKTTGWASQAPIRATRLALSTRRRK